MLVPAVVGRRVRVPPPASAVIAAKLMPVSAVRVVLVVWVLRLAVVPVMAPVPPLSSTAAPERSIWISVAPTPVKVRPVPLMTFTPLIFTCSILGFTPAAPIWMVVELSSVPFMLSVSAAVVPWKVIAAA